MTSTAREGLKLALCGVDGREHEVSMADTAREGLKPVRFVMDAFNKL
ncbi:MAG: hypothetical protein NVSMB38_43430 [Ktedonobacteraceae bacterium]